MKKELSFENKAMLDDSTKQIMQKIIEKKVLERMEWIDKTVLAILPPWKAKLLKAIPFRFMSRLLRINIEITSKMEENGDTLVEIKQNGEVKDLRVFTVV